VASENLPKTLIEFEEETQSKRRVDYARGCRSYGIAQNLDKSWANIGKNGLDELKLMVGECASNLGAKELSESLICKA
jgi:hypothetical protein